MEPAEFIARTRAIGAGTATLLARRWDAGGLWADQAWQASLIVAAGQARAASVADAYVSSQVGGSDISLDPQAFAGVASDGRPLVTLMQGAAIAASGASGGEFPLLRYSSLQEKQGAVDRAAKSWLQMMALTQVADVARAAMRTSMAVRNASGVRIASAPCCGRCAVLHGRFYSWRADFPRHPRCDCTYQPVKGDDWEAPEEIPLDQIRGLSQADRKAIELGSDRNRVINAQRGMYTTEIHGQKVKATLDSTARRNSAFPVRDNPNTVRLRPESILKYATDDADAIRLLAHFGYIK